VGCSAHAECVQIALEWQSETIAPKNLPELLDEPKTSPIINYEFGNIMKTPNLQ